MKTHSVVLIFSALILLPSRSFSQFSYVLIQNVESNQEIQAVSRLAVDQVNQKIKGNYLNSRTPVPDSEILIFKGLIGGKRLQEVNSVMIYLLIKVQLRSGEERNIFSELQVIGSSKTLLHWGYA